MRFRGFWPVSSGGKGKSSFKGKVKEKFQKGHSSSRKSLEQRILSSQLKKPKTLYFELMSLPLLRLPVRFPQIQREELITGVIQVAHDPMPSPQRLTSSAMENRPLEANVHPSNSSNQEDQPDQEPRFLSHTQLTKNRELTLTLQFLRILMMTLYVKAFSVMMSMLMLWMQFWKSEILVPEHDIQSWRQESDPSEMTFLATAAKKQRSEVRLSELSTAEREEFSKAQDAEVTNWLKTGTVQKMFCNQLSPEQILKCRWILTWKSIEAADRGPKHSEKAHKAELDWWSWGSCILR